MIGDNALLFIRSSTTFQSVLFNKAFLQKYIVSLQFFYLYYQTCAIFQESSKIESSMGGIHVTRNVQREIRES